MALASWPFASACPLESTATAEPGTALEPQLNILEEQIRAHHPGTVLANTKTVAPARRGQECLEGGGACYGDNEDAAYWLNVVFRVCNDNKTISPLKGMLPHTAYPRRVQSSRRLNEKQA